MSSRSNTTSDNLHFKSDSEYNILRHRPHKTLIYYFNALRATALFRIWPHMLFFAGWSSMVVCLNIPAHLPAKVPTTMITVLGVLLGLTLSYRTSSAYEKYSEGRKLWSQITLASRNWARIVWLHCPDTMSANPPMDPQAAAYDTARATLEKKTIVQLALAFAVAVKHYLRGEEGIMYEDLYHLVNFIPTLDLPSGFPECGETTIAEGLPTLSSNRKMPSHDSAYSIQKGETFEVAGLKPANCPPQFEWSSMFKSKQKKKHGVSPIERRLNTGEIFVAQRHGQNVPLEVALFMSSWINTLANRKVIDTVVQTQLQAHLNSLMDALSSLERILTTPIPWSYNCHIWEVSWIYCLALPFQIIEGFRWVTIPATVITAYIVFGYGSIAEEIENPFGYDKNDLNLTYFCNGIIAKELDAITARPMANPDDFIFTNNNWPLGPTQPTAQQLVSEPLTTIRNRLAMAPARGQEAEARHSDV